MQKPLPPLRYELFHPPIFDSEYFRYFEQAASHPFRHETTEFAAVNAWWLAEISLLAYCPPEYAVPVFRRAGLELSEAGICIAGQTQCYLATAESWLVVCFRGTKPLRPDRWDSPEDRWRNLAGTLGDARTDADLYLVELSPGSGRYVHRGFLAALEQVWSALEAHLRDLVRRRPERRVWFTGHSLGGALATLAADRFPAASGLYTFGSPQVGDQSFAQDFTVPCYRLVNGRDLVPWLPPAGPYAPPKLGLAKYRHVGKLKYLDAQGGIGDDLPPAPEIGQWLKSRPGELLDRLRRAQSGHPLALAPEALNDHAPLLYAVKLWNLYDRGLLGGEGEGARQPR